MQEKYNIIKNYVLDKIEYLSIYQYFSENEIAQLIDFYANKDNDIDIIKREIDEKVNEVVSLYFARANEPYNYKNAIPFYSITLDDGTIIPIASYHMSDNELHLHSAIPNNEEGRLYFKELKKYISKKYYSNSNLSEEEIRTLSKIEHEDKVIENVICSLLKILEKNPHLSNVSLETNEYFARYVSDVFRSYGFKWEKRSNKELEDLGLNDELSKNRTDVLICDRKLLIDNIQNRDKKIQMSPELKIIFDTIIKNASKSSEELLNIYLNEPKYLELKEKLEKKDAELKEKLKFLREQNSSLSNAEFFYKTISQNCQELISLIKQEYGEQLSLETLSIFENFNLDIIYDEDFKHDITAHPENGRISINMAHFTKGENIDLIGRTARAISTMPHELFHFMFKILKEKSISDERFIYKLTNGEIVSSHGGLGHMLSEGLAEYLSSKFCEKYDLFYGLNPSYIGFSELAKYIIEKGNLSEEFLLNNNIDGIISCFSSEVLHKYLETERLEFAQQFEIKEESNGYRKLSLNEIESTNCEKKVSQAKRLQEEQKKGSEEIGKLLILKNSDTTNNGKVNYIYMFCIVIIIIIVGLLISYFIK